MGNNILLSVNSKSLLVDLVPAELFTGSTFPVLILNIDEQKPYLQHNIWSIHTGLRKKDR